MVNRQNKFHCCIRDIGELTMLVADGFDNAIIGYIERMNEPKVVVYDRDKCIEILVERDHMTEDDADEFFEYNVAGAYVGEQTPAYLIKANRMDIDDIGKGCE